MFFVQRKVLELYQRMDTISYPIQPETLLPCVPHSCRIMSYQKTAEVAGCSVQDVAVLCKSNSGATHYDPELNRYLILYNGSMNPGRVRWTLGHEIGHICIGHLETMEVAENCLYRTTRILRSAWKWSRLFCVEFTCTIANITRNGNPFSWRTEDSVWPIHSSGSTSIRSLCEMVQKPYTNSMGKWYAPCVPSEKCCKESAVMKKRIWVGLAAVIVLICVSIASKAFLTNPSSTKILHRI